MNKSIRKLTAEIKWMQHKNQNLSNSVFWISFVYDSCRKAARRYVFIKRMPSLYFSHKKKKKTFRHVKMLLQLSLQYNNDPTCSETLQNLNKKQTHWFIFFHLQSFFLRTKMEAVDTNATHADSYTTLYYFILIKSAIPSSICEGSNNLTLMDFCSC